MGEWLTYGLSDLLLFSERVYWRLFLLENAALWPLPLIAPVALAGAVLLHTRRPEAGLRLLFGLLALAWLLTGWQFVWQRYAPVNWAMLYVAPLFAVHAAVLGGLALRGPDAPVSASGWARWLGYGLVLAGALAYPFLALLQGRTLAGAEVAGLAPDPTAVVSLGAAVLVPGRRQRVAVLLLPVLWLGQSALTLYVLDGWAALAPTLALAAASIGLILCPRR